MTEPDQPRPDHPEPEVPDTDRTGANPYPGPGPDATTPTPDPDAWTPTPGHDPYAHDPYGQHPYPHDPYGQGSYPQDPYAGPVYGGNPFGQQPPPPPSYSEPMVGYGTPVPPAAPRTNTTAIISLATAILGLPCCGLFSVVGIITGVVARQQIRHSNGWETGDGLAIAGIIVGSLVVVLWVIALAVGAAID